MTVYSAIPGQGTLLQVSISSALTTIAKRCKIKGPPRKRSEVDTTDLDVGTDGFPAAETSLPGILRTGEVELTVNWNPGDTTHAYLESSIEAGTTESWVYKLSNGSTYAFSGWIKELDLGEVDTDQLQKGSIKIRVTGAVTVTP